MAPKELLILHHTHVDIGYTHPQVLVWDLHDRYLDEAIEWCERTADYPEGSRMKWTCEVTSVALNWLKTASPRQVERMRRLVANGQIGFGAMLYHWTALHQEDMLRESLKAVKTVREQLGADIRYAMQTDVNGTPWSVPDMLLDVGVEGFMMSINIHMGGFPLSRPKAFRWQAPSGRELTVFSGEHYNAFTRETGMRSGAPNAGSTHRVDLDEMQAGLERYFVRLEKKGWDHDFAVLTATHPCMDDNGPPNPLLPELVRSWNERGSGPFIRIVSLEELFARIGKLGEDKLPVHGGDWTDYWTNGIAASALEVTMSRRAHGALWGARALETVLPPDASRSRAEAAAMEALHQANEHTWNVFASTGALGVGGSGRIEPIPEAEQRLHKSNQCASSLSYARMARRDALDALAGNPPQSQTEEGLLVFNPSELPRHVCLRLPKELIHGNYQIVAGTKHRIDVIEDVLAETGATLWAGPVEVPALSHLTVPLDGLSTEVPENPGDCGAGFIRSPFWKLCYDEATGAITSLIHLESGTEYFDANAGFDLFSPIEETLAKSSPLAKEVRDPRASIFRATERNFDEIVHEDGQGWETDWHAEYTRPGPAKRIRFRSNLEGKHLDRWYDMPGINGEIRLTISLLRHEDRVRFTAYFNKADIMEPESLYFSFPFLMESAQAHFDTAGVVVAFEDEQLPGASRGWVTAGSMVVVEGPQGGSLTLACPDAPLFQIGGFHYGRDLRDANNVNQALLFGWPMNNYWNTNFRASQPGLVRFRYELTRSAAFDPAGSVRFASAVARPVMFHPVVSMDAASPARTLVAGLPDSVSIVSLKATGPDSLILVLREHGGTLCEVNPTFPGRVVRSIELTDILEEKTLERVDGQPLVIPARATAAFRVSFAD